MSIAIPEQLAFRCNHCWQTTISGSDCVGQSVPCINCQQAVFVPEATPARLEEARTLMAPHVSAPAATTFATQPMSDAEMYRYARQEARIGASMGALACSRYRRFFAAMIDAFCIGTLAVLGVMLGAAMFPSKTDELTPQAMMLFISLPSMLIVFHWVLTATHGQTIGKMLLNIKIVDREGEAPGFLQGVVLRYWVTGLLGYIPFFSLFDSIMIFFNDDKRCIHDYLAGTYVIEAS